MRSIVIILGCFLSYALSGQNCKAYLYFGDTLKYEACLIAEERAGHYQYSRAYQEALDRSLEKCPDFAYAYWHKSVAYLKSGDFLTWKKLIDKAVELEPLEFLATRGWCRYQFFRDYAGAIKDIERLDSMTEHDIGHSSGGKYHLQMGRALCYKALGQPDKAIEIMATQLADTTYVKGPYDHLHLGVLYLEQRNLAQASSQFEQQSRHYEIAENQYYLGLLKHASARPHEARTHFNQAKALYLKEERMFDPYVHQPDKVYLQQIMDAIERTVSKGTN